MSNRIFNMHFDDTPVPNFAREVEAWRLATNRLAVEAKATPIDQLIREYLDADDAYLKRGTRTNHNRRTVAKRKLRERIT